jgi:amino acid permease
MIDNISLIRLVGGTESLGITAGETKNPSKNMPRIVKLVFWRSDSCSRFACLIV